MPGTRADKTRARTCILLSRRTRHRDGHVHPSPRAARRVVPPACPNTAPPPPRLPEATRHRASSRHTRGLAWRHPSPRRRATSGRPASPGPVVGRLGAAGLLRRGVGTSGALFPFSSDSQK
jgi:hypothetical protein